MSDTDFMLCNLPDSSLDAIISLTNEQKQLYITTMIESHFPSVEKDSELFINLAESYLSSFYVEKLYRSNRFFNEKFTPIYTNKGLIRNIVADIYYSRDELITH